MMHVLVTRPEPDATDLRTRLESMGHRVSVFPLLDISFRDSAPIDLSDANAIVVTSRNGLRALARRTELEQAVALPILTVGPGTGALARSLGFKTVIEGPASARELVDVVVKHPELTRGTIIHIRPEEPAYDVTGALRAKGVNVREAILYASMARDTLDPTVAEAIRAGSLDAVLLMSPRAASTFVGLITKAGLEDGARKIAFLCLSDAVAQSLVPLSPLSIEIANKPNLEEMLALVTVLAPKLR